MLINGISKYLSEIMAKTKAPKTDSTNNINNEIFAFKNRDNIGSIISVNLCAKIK